MLEDMDQRQLEQVCEEYGLDLVVLFGSRARGEGRPDSDYDVGVRRREGVVPAKDFLKLGYHLSRALGVDDVDLVDLRRASPLLRYQVAKVGKVVYEARPGLFTRFHVLSWKLYQDERYDLRRFDDVYLERSLQRLLT